MRSRVLAAVVAFVVLLVFSPVGAPVSPGTRQRVRLQGAVLTLARHESAPAHQTEVPCDGDDPLAAQVPPPVVYCSPEVAAAAPAAERLLALLA